MERYRNFVRVEQMKENIRSGRMDAALELAALITPAKVRSTVDVNILADLYMEHGMLEKARDCLLELYGRKKSRSVLMQLINVSIRLKDVSSAEKYYREFRNMASGDFYSFIFRYNIDKIEGKPLPVLIENLERLKKVEYIDTWAYELAKLYHKAGDRDKCIRECDDIETWFGDGVYVDRARALKAYYLGELDINKLDPSVGVGLKDDTDENSADMTDPVDDADTDGRIADNGSDVPKPSVNAEFAGELPAYDRNRFSAGRPSQARRTDDMVEISSDDTGEDDEDMTLAEECEAAAAEDEAAEEDEISAAEGEAAADDEEAAEEDVVSAAEDEAAEEDEISAAEDEAAADDEEAAEEDVVSAAEVEAADEAETVAKADNESGFGNINIPTSLLNKAARNNKFRDEEEDMILEEDDDYEIKIADEVLSAIEGVVTESDKLLEGPMLADQDEDTESYETEFEPEELEAAVEPRKLPDEEPEEADAEPEVPASETKPEPMKADEEPVSEVKPEAPAAKPEPVIAKPAVEPEAPVSETKPEPPKPTPPKRMSKPVDTSSFDEDDETEALIMKLLQEEEDMLASEVGKVETEDEQSEKEVDKAPVKESGKDTAAEAIETAVHEFKGLAASPLPEKGYLADFLKNNNCTLEDYFEFFAYQSEVRSQLIKTLELLLNPAVRNVGIVITGEHDSGVKSIVKGITRILFQSGYLKSKQVAFTDADRINHMDLAGKIEQLKGCCIAISTAGGLSEQAARQLLELNDGLAGKTAFVLSDYRSEVNRLFRDNRELNSMFPHRIHIPSFDKEDLEDLVFVKLKASNLELAKDALEPLRKEIRRITREVREGSLMEMGKFINAVVDEIETRNARLLIAGTLSGAQTSHDNIVKADDINKAVEAKHGK